MLFISPPFGNYINLPYTKSIKGSFTLKSRPGLFGQILRTLRYSFEEEGWVNKIGLRNKGIDWAIYKYKYDFFNFYRESVISIAILEESEVDKFLEKLPDDMDLEINISCPNTEHALISKNVHKFINPNRNWCSIKLSPLVEYDDIDSYYNQGFRKFHCSNTIPVENGGLSGKQIIPYNTALIKYIKHKYPDVEIIAGGGIRNIHTLNKYKYMGADHFSISSVFFNPFLVTKLYLDWIFN